MPDALPNSNDTIELLHTPKGSMRRATLALLEERDAEFSVREYLTDPLDAAELRDLAGRLGKPIGEWLRSGEAAFAESGLSKQASAEELIALVASQPSCMQRPILVRGNRAVIGRPPQDVLALL